MLVQVVDLAARDPEADHETIREELRLHDPRLLAKPFLVAANKSDLPAAAANLRAFLAARRRDGLTALAVSALSGEGIGALTAALARLLPDAEALARGPEPMGVVVHRFDPGRDAFAVQREGDAYRVRGRRIERMAAQTDFAVDESAQRFQRDLERMGVDRALRRAGVEPGDTVRIGAVELEWQPESWA